MYSICHGSASHLAWINLQFYFHFSEFFTEQSSSSNHFRTTLLNVSGAEHWEHGLVTIRTLSCELQTKNTDDEVSAGDWSETGGTKQTTPRNRNKSETMRETGLNVWSELLEWSSASGRRSQCQLTSDTLWPAPLRPLAPVADTHQTGTRDNTNPGLYYMSLISSNFKIHPWFN